MKIKRLFIISAALPLLFVPLESAAELLPSVVGVGWTNGWVREWRKDVPGLCVTDSTVRVSDRLTKVVRRWTWTGDKPLDDYVEERVKWPENYNVARFVARYTIGADGVFRLGEVLQSTDHQLRKRVLKVLQELPKWQPATKQGKAVESEYVLTIQLPKGKEMPKEPYIVIR